MAKLSKKTKNELLSTLTAINKVIDFINRDNIAICNITKENAESRPRSDQYYNDKIETIEYSNPNRNWTINYQTRLSPIDKGIGSDLVSIYTAKQIIQRLLTEE